MKPIAIQLYTVRDACAQDFPGTCKKIAEIGYKGVELAGLHGMTPAEARAMLDDLGLVVCSSHGAMPTAENAGQIIDEAGALGYRYHVSGFGPDQFKTLADTKASAAAFKAAADALSGSDLQFGFHNHWWEFEAVGGLLPHDVLLDEAPGVFAELDVYWAAFGGADPVAQVRRKAKRVPLLHIKDGELVPGEHIHTAVGKGKLDMPAIIGAADPNVLKWLIVELDACKTNMMQAVIDSYAYLTGEGLASGNK